MKITCVVPVLTVNIKLLPHYFGMPSCFSHGWLFATPWTVTLQTSLSMRFRRQEYWSGLTFPPPGIFLTHRLSLRLFCLLHWQAHSLSLAPLPKVYSIKIWSYYHLLTYTWISPIMTVGNFRVSSSSLNLYYHFTFLTEFWANLTVVLWLLNTIPLL